MAAKVQETENKKASKARIREGERGQWWPCETTDTELRELQNEGMISAHWSFIRDTVVPKPGAGEVVMTKAWVERGLSLPCSEFFLSILNTYGLQPHNICPNSYLLLSNFATLCEGHLGIRPDVKLWQFFFRVKKETKDKAMLNCGSMTFMLRPGRMYPPHDSHESVRYWNAGWFYEKNVSVPEIHDGLPKFNNEPPEELASWSFVPSLADTSPTFLFFHEASEQRKDQEGATAHCTIGRRGSGVAAPPYGVAASSTFRGCPSAYIAPASKTLTEEATHAKPSRAAAIAGQDPGDRSLCPGLTDGEVPPEGFSIDTAAISTAIFINAAAPMKRE
ncbi:hypothetical protein QYE76_049360 [Lolium multiflorum]|uniref:Transposase (putative) gypsy type domain-containing protein n=1 Tax=Lolium multiflorum TaxID=4521 RepID=A0AAD8SMY5_LOLMU|nr:hypothetical protein QYE76_049360 [Lolium multiflorum]